MREIKFRAWNGSRMITPACIGEFGEWYETGRDYENGMGDKEGLMQFTGLHDKNGKEIYEGDIVTCEITERENYDEYNSNVPLKVYWDDRAAGFFPFHKASQWRSDVENIEVTGNIYSNPELLNKTI